MSLTQFIEQPVEMPAWSLTYQGVAITGHIESMVKSIEYTSHLGGKTPELEVRLEDHQRRWQGPWYPQEGDTVALAIGYAGTGLVSCGTFQVDEGEIDTAEGDTFVMRCIAAFITPAMRTPNSATYRNQTLTQIAATIAAKYGLTLISEPESPDVSLALTTQSQQTDLEFLAEIADAYDYEFTVRGTNLVFYSRTAIESVAPATALDRSGMLPGASFKHKTRRIFKAASVSYFDPDTKALISALATPRKPAQTQTAATANLAAGLGVFGPLVSGDTLKLAQRCENGQHAALRAQAALHRHNKEQTTGTIMMPGSVAYAAGNVTGISGFGAFDGNYIVTRARHLFAPRRGYVTTLAVRGIANG